MGAALPLSLQPEIPRLLVPLLKPARYKSIEGGRGSAKSHTVAGLLVDRAFMRKTRILCVREIQRSIKQSSKRLIEDKIRSKGLEAFFEIKNDTIVCKRNGSEFIFSGMQDHTADAVKSMEGIDICWIEEAQKLSRRSWVILTPTIRNPGSEIWATWNPDLEEDEVYVRTWKEPWLPLEDMVRIKINWRDNPWFPDVLNHERVTLKNINLDLYNHVWEGHLRSKAGLLFKRKWFDENLYDPEELPKHLTKYLSSDYASADIEDLEEEGSYHEPDFTEFGVFGMDEHGILWVLDWWFDQVDPEKWIEAALDMVRKHSPARYFEESGVIYRSTKGAFNKRMRERGLWVQREPMPSTGSKADRALGFAAYMAAGKVKWPRAAPWLKRIIDQYCSFTGEDGRKDDAVDVGSKLAQGLDSMSAAVPPQRKKPRIIRPLTEEHFMYSEHADDAARRKRAYHES